MLDMGFIGPVKEIAAAHTRNSADIVVFRHVGRGRLTDSQTTVKKIQSASAWPQIMNDINQFDNTSILRTVCLTSTSCLIITCQTVI